MEFKHLSMDAIKAKYPWVTPEMVGQWRLQPEWLLGYAAASLVDDGYGVCVKNPMQFWRFMVVHGGADLRLLNSAVRTRDLARIRIGYNRACGFLMGWLDAGKEPICGLELRPFDDGVRDFLHFQPNFDKAANAGSN